MAGKFDPYRRDLEFDAAHQALRALGRLLLAEPEQELAQVRGRIVAAVGPNAGLLAATVPEFAALLGVDPDPGDPLTAQLRAQHAAAGVLRAVASPDRPVVVFVDDLQWAGRAPLGLVDLVLGGEPAEGLLLVAAYRDDEAGAAGAAGGAAGAMAGPARRAAAAAREPARRGAGRDGGGDAAGGRGRGGGPGRADRAVHGRQPVRDGGAAQRAAPRRRAGRGGRAAGDGTTAAVRAYLGQPRCPGWSRRGSKRCHPDPGSWWRRWRAWAGGPS